MDGKVSSISKILKNGGVLCLYGDLGSGKTTYTQSLAKELGIDKFKVKSPTYTYIRKYSITAEQSLFHIDLYRLEEPDHDIIEEIEEILHKENNIVVIEWADRIQNYLPKKRIEILIEYKGGNSREFKINHLG